MKMLVFVLIINYRKEKRATNQFTLPLYLRQTKRQNMCHLKIVVFLKRIEDIPIVVFSRRRLVQPTSSTRAHGSRRQNRRIRRLPPTAQRASWGFLPPLLEAQFSSPAPSFGPEEFYEAWPPSTLGNVPSRACIPTAFEVLAVMLTTLAVRQRSAALSFSA